MKSWKEERLHKPSQGAKALREYADSDDGFEVVHKYAYRAFTKILSDIYDKFEDKYDLDTIEYALDVALTDASADFQGNEG